MAVVTTQELEEIERYADMPGHSDDVARKYLRLLVAEIHLKAAYIERLKDELKASNETIAMLYERSGRFAAQADKYEAEITSLRRHLGEIP